MSQTKAQLLEDFISVKTFGAVGDGVADDTAAIQNFINAGGGYIPPGTYLIDGLTVSSKIDVVCSNKATLKKRSTSGLITLAFVSGSAESSWEGGIFDANSSLNAGWTYVGVDTDRQAINVAERRITLRGISFSNWPNHPLVAGGDYLSANDLVFVNCATGPLFGWAGAVSGGSRPANASGIGQKVNGVTLISCGNLAGVSGTMQHGFDTYGCRDSTYSDVMMVALDSPVSGASYAISGHTDKLSESCVFDSFTYSSPISTQHQHLAFSHLGSKNCTVSNFTAIDFAGIGLEVLSCYGCTYTNVAVDQKYRVTTYTPSGVSKGASVDKGRYNPEGALSRDIQGTKGNTFTSCLFRRCGLGIDIKSGQSIFNGCTVLGSVGTGIVVNQTAVIDSFPGAAKAPVTDVTFASCRSRWNGAQGINVQEAETVTVIGGDYSNNGQDNSYASTTRSGVVASIATRLSVVNATLNDTQAFTVSGGASFAAGSTTNNRYTFCLAVPTALSEGQYITLVNAGGAGVNLTGKIVDLDSEDAVIEFAGPQTFASTGNTTALSGTWSGSGTTLVGSSGNAIAEVTGPVFITDGTNWRKVIRVNSNNSITLESAFPASLSGASLTKLAVAINGVPSQQYGARIFGTVVNAFIKGTTAFGNVLERTLISTFAGVQPGSEYWRKSTVTANAATIDLQTGVYNGHRLVGWALWNSSAISGGGATSFDLRRTDSGGTLKETLASSLSLSLNQKPRGNASGGIVATNDKVVAAFNGGTPTTGTIVGEFFYHVELPEVL